MKFNQQTEKILEELTRQERINVLKTNPELLSTKLYTVFLHIIPPDDNGGIVEYEVNAMNPKDAEKQAVIEFFKEYDLDDQQAEELYQHWENGDDYDFDEYEIDTYGVYLGKLTNLI